MKLINNCKEICYSVSQNIDMDIIDGEAIIINNITKKALILNNSAFQILELFDSYKNPLAITIDDFTNIFISNNNISNPSFDDIKNDIIVTIQTLLDENVIIVNDCNKE